MTTMGYGYGNMMGYGYSSMMWPWMILVAALVFAGLIALILVIVRLTRTGHPQALAPDNQTPRRILDERYARGEISLEEYRQRRETII